MEKILNSIVIIQNQLKNQSNNKEIQQVIAQIREDTSDTDEIGSQIKGLIDEFTKSSESIT